MLREVADEGGIFDRASAVADAIDSKGPNRGPYALRSAGFSRVGGGAKAEASCALVHGREWLRWKAVFGAPDADANDAEIVLDLVNRLEGEEAALGPVIPDEIGDQRDFDVRNLTQPSANGLRDPLGLQPM